jgi:hypothetical protein
VSTPPTDPAPANQMRKTCHREITAHDGRIGTAQIQFCYESKDALLRDILGGDVSFERHEQFLIADFLYDE